VINAYKEALNENKTKELSLGEFLQLLWDIPLRHLVYNLLDKETGKKNNFISENTNTIKQQQHYHQFIEIVREYQENKSKPPRLEPIVEIKIIDPITGDYMTKTFTEERSIDFFRSSNKTGNFF
jgi:hypothetical protein